MYDWSLGLTILTYGLIALGVWAAVIVYFLVRTIIAAKQMHGKIRRNDIFHVVSLLVVLIAVFIVVFIWPGLISMLPTSTAFLEVAAIPLFVHFFEVSYRDWRRLKAS